jgi:2'-5' RNA ligase
MKQREKPSGEVVRTFICIEIPDSVKQRIDELQKTLRKIEAQVSWTKPANIHLTLKFLGAVPVKRIERVRKAVERAAEGIGAFQIEVAGAGCFPSARNPRVLWIGLSNIPDVLRELFEKLEDELAQEGFAREKRKFSPHLTIGRARTPHNAVRVAEELIASGFEAEKFEASELIVMRSDLKPTGSIYTPQATINLRE